ncbi:HU family DNA-binding protein [Micromonospora musae]|uniref:HU family DNA-binding protein n=1 Tax=Micromonospora musae TaxID=1894970 RepID=A0ABX9R939_9ACTN|nr:HU family DNA-binding protein [Micromonospora musae]
MRAEWLASSQLHNREEVVNKAELIEALAVRLGDRKMATAALDAVLAEVQAAVTKGEKVAITGFGAFEKRVRGARTARNPRTGEAVKVKKTSVPTFRAGAGFKEMVASGKVPKATAAAKKTTTAAKTTGTKATKATTAKATTAKATRAKATGTKTTAAAKKTTAAKKTATKATKTTAATKKATPARKTAAAGRTAAAKKTTAAAKSTTAKKAPAKKTAAKKAPAKKAASRR